MTGEGQGHYRMFFKERSPLLVIAYVVLVVKQRAGVVEAWDGGDVHFAFGVDNAGEELRMVVVEQSSEEVESDDVVVRMVVPEGVVLGVFGGNFLCFAV